MSHEQPPLDRRLEAWIAVVAYYWHRQGVPDADRALLRSGLEHDLRLAVALGAPVADLADIEPSRCAAALAAGVRPLELLRDAQSLSTSSCLLTAAAGAIVGAMIAVAYLYPAGFDVLATMPFSYAGQAAFTAGLHVAAACVCAIFAMGAVRWRLGWVGRVEDVAGVGG